MTARALIARETGSGSAGNEIKYPPNEPGGMERNSLQNYDDTFGIFSAVTLKLPD